MLQELHLHNYKCFADQKVPFAALTLLTGMNGTGKSSVLQALLLLRQCYQQLSPSEREIASRHDLTSVDSAQEATFELSGEDVTAFQLRLHNNHDQTWHFFYNHQTDVLSAYVPHGSEKSAEPSIFSENFCYLPAERAGIPQPFAPWDLFAMKSRQLALVREYSTTHFLQIYGDKIQVSADLAHPNEEARDLRSQVAAWLSEISPAPRVAPVPEQKTNAQPTVVVKNKISNALSTPDVSLGLTYALPIVVAVLSSQPGGLLLIENPETHLHPKGQSLMGRLLAHAAHCGIQVVVETHSDHFFDTIRIAVHDKKLTPDDVQIHFFQGQKDGQTQMVSPRLDRNGRISQWPHDFFDESRKNLATLIFPTDK